MENDTLEQLKHFYDQGQPFVLATVVRVEKPTSSKPGAKAVITRDGSLTGWIGGSCTEPTVIKEAAKAIKDGHPRLLRLCPPEKMGLEPQEGVTEITLACASGGTLEIYLEPYLSQPHLLVIGHQAVAKSLVVMGSELGYSTTLAGEAISQGDFPTAGQMAEGTDFSQLKFSQNTYVVVASHGNYDEIALEAALASKAPYIALVASKKRWRAIRTYLQQAGLPDTEIDRVKCPAGLDFGAITPAEIAVSILAEVIQIHRQRMAPDPVEESPEAPETALDPVCGMTVEIRSAPYTAGYQGQIYYFCSAHCQHLFEKGPEDFIHPELITRPDENRPS